MTNENAQHDRLSWVEPTVIVLDVADTAQQFGKGGDGTNGTTDCSKS